MANEPIPELMLIAEWLHQLGVDRREYYTNGPGRVELGPGMATIPGIADIYRIEDFVKYRLEKARGLPSGDKEYDYFSRVR